MAEVDQLEVTIVHALATRQELVSLRVAPGCTIAEAVVQSEILGVMTQTEAVSLDLGVFGERRSAGDLVCQGDRIEIYRPLQDDPKVIRRRRAEQQGRG
jgi:putative ubiquitin-RnfH superfamily antitoxin RatB of RatAB toxin-antitoxin module